MKELDKSELQEVEGGFLCILLSLAVPLALQCAVFGFLAAGVVGSFEAGYKSEINKK